MNVFSSLSTREKRLVGGVVPLAILVACYYFVWAPLQESQKNARADISAFRLVQDTAALASVGAIAPAAAPNDTPLATRITSSATDAELTLRRIEPENDSIRVTLDDTPFAAVMLWLSNLEEQHGVTVQAIEVNRRPAPGIISARLLLGELQ